MQKAQNGPNKIALDESHTWLLTVNHNQFNLEIATHVITFIN